MEHGQSTRKVHLNPAIRKNIPPNKNVVWRVQGGQTHNVCLDFSGWKKQRDPEVRCDDGVAPSLVHDPSIDWVEAESVAQARAHSRTRGARVDLSADHNLSRTVIRSGRDANLDRWPELEKIIDRLSNCDLGPGGFFVICHRDTDFRPE